MLPKAGRAGVLIPVAFCPTDTDSLGRLGWDRQPDCSGVPTRLSRKGNRSCSQSKGKHD